MIAVMSQDICNQFQNATNIKAYPLKPYNCLATPVSSHCDMLLCKIDNIVFCYEEYYKENLTTFQAIEKQGYKINFVSSKCKEKYPNDIALNVLVVGKYIFCKTSNTAKEILEYAKRNGYKIVNVNQGYSACSCLTLNDSTVITGDKGMQNVLEDNNISVVYFDNSQIVLNGYNCGFIGGAGEVKNNKIYFFGPKTALEDNLEIKSIISRENFEIISILSDRVYDFGGLKLF